MTKADELKSLQSIPGVGKKISELFWNIGFKKIDDFKKIKAETLYLKICTSKGYQVDRRFLYVCRLVVYYVTHTKYDPEKLNWWYWKDPTR